MVEPERIIPIEQPALGLRAVLVIDSTVLGPAAGGTRTYPYKSLEAATDDARQLARAMTLKCSIGGLAAGGAKCAVIDHPGLDRPRAFAHLGSEFQKLQGRFRTGGDFGTGPDDIRAMATQCDYVHCDGAMGEAVARGVVGCAGVAWSAIAGRDLASARVAVQGCGAVGAPVARAFAARGARLLVADVDSARAERVAEETGAQVISPEHILAADVDILAPCALGGVLSKEALDQMSACIVCGAANNLFPDPRLPETYHQRGVIVVPDFLASAGGVISGIARAVMGMTDPSPLISRMRDTTRAILAESTELDEPPFLVGERMALARLRKR